MRLVKLEGIDLVFWDFKHPIKGMYYHPPDCQHTIGIARNIVNDAALFNSVLAEELGHHYTSRGVSLPVEHFNQDQREHINLVEFKARKWAALKLMPRDRLLAALTAGITDIGQLAARFNVTEEIVEVRLCLSDLKQGREGEEET